MKDFLSVIQYAQTKDIVDTLAFLKGILRGEAANA